MKTKISNADDNNKQGHSHTKHIWMMAICCGLPIIGFLAFGLLGLSIPSIETLFLVICPIGMIGMVYMMNRDNQEGNKGNSCCQSEKSEDASVADMTCDVTENSEHRPPRKLQQPDSLEA